MNIKEGHSNIFDGSNEFILTRGDIPLGSVHFKPRKLFQPAELCLIKTYPNEGEGYGKELIQEFIKKVGYGHVVTTDIIHKETWETLRQLDLLREAYEQGVCAVTNHHLLSETIPITRFLERSGIHIRRLDITRRKNILFPTYADVIDLYDNSDAHFANFFRTKIFGNIK